MKPKHVKGKSEENKKVNKTRQDEQVGNKHLILFLVLMIAEVTVNRMDAAQTDRCNSNKKRTECHMT